jgi:hypothetical protein
MHEILQALPFVLADLEILPLSRNYHTDSGTSGLKGRGEIDYG